MPSLIINNAPTSPGLLDQPNEVLHMIVSYLPDRSFIKFADEDGVRRRVHQYLVVAQVCQRLRTVVLQADFWLDPQIPLFLHRSREGTLFRSFNCCGRNFGGRFIESIVGWRQFCKVSLEKDGVDFLEPWNATDDRFVRKLVLAEYWDCILVWAHACEYGAQISQLM